MRTRRATALACTTVTVCALTALGAAPASGAVPSSPQAQAVSAVDGLLAQHRGDLAAGSEEAFGVRDVVLDADGASHVRLARTYRGLPVIGGDVVVHTDRRHGFAGVSRTQRSALALSTTPSTTSTQARAAAVRAAVGVRAATVASPVLAITTRTPTPRLVWTVLVTGTDAAGGPSELRQTLDATSLALVDSVQGIETAKPAPPPAGTAVAATGSTLYVGSVGLTASLAGSTYSLQDPTRGGQSTSDLGGRTSGSGTLVTSTTSTFGNGSTTSRATIAADAAYGVAQTWDYYKATFGRNGIANDGRGAPSRVHYGRAYNNAFWSDSCFCMTYGDGDGVQFTPLVSLDVAGHEMSHGVTSRTAGLTYSGESGGLNESTSDIFGTMVEFRANNAQDVPDYTIGEEITPGGGGLRSMATPSSDGASKDCWYSGIGSLDVHYSSGVGNHFFYLLAQGTKNSTACNKASLTGIGNDAAQQIWYRALTVYMTSSTDYHGARTATLKAASDLYGATSPQYAAVDAAWTGVSVV